MQRYFIKNKDMLLEESDIKHIKKVMRMNINDKIIEALGQIPEQHN